MSKVFDCFMFHSELDMAELRFNILKDAVDYHVVIESGQTHSGQPKARIFGDALEAGCFAEFEDRIIYSFSPTLEGAHSWDREHFHRGLISGVLMYTAHPDDWVIVGDCDEIPNPDMVRTLVERPVDRPVVFELGFYYYDFSHQVQQGWGIGACKWSVEQDANKIRTAQFAAPSGINTCKDGGWHLSYFMTPDQVVEKLNAFMHHGDVAKDVPRDAAWIADKMRNGVDLFGRTVEIVEVDPELHLPQYVKDHREKYEALGWLKLEKVRT